MGLKVTHWYDDCITEFVHYCGYCFGVFITQGSFVVVLVVIDAADSDVLRVEVKI